MKKVKLLMVFLMMFCLVGCDSSGKSVSAIHGSNEETIHLNKYLYFNGYKFTLGGSLDLFVAQTHIQLDEKQYEAAIKATKSVSGMYYKVDASLDEGETHCNITVYIDTSDLNDIKIQGISMESDRGWVDLEPNFLTNPNLITCGFVFLNDYDIDKDSFAEMAPELQNKAIKRKNKYTEKYDLKLEEDNFGIQIQFDSLKEKSDRIYITYINVTNKADLAW